MSLGLKCFCNRHVIMVQMTVTFLWVTVGSCNKQSSFIIRLRLCMASAFRGSPLEKIYTSVIWWWFNHIKSNVKPWHSAKPCFLFISCALVKRGSETVLCTLRINHICLTSLHTGTVYVRETYLDELRISTKWFKTDRSRLSGAFCQT